MMLSLLLLPCCEQAIQAANLLLHGCEGKAKLRSHFGAESGLLICASALAALLARPLVLFGKL